MAERFRAPARTLAALAVCVVLAPAAAHAQEVTMYDSVGDAQAVTTYVPPVGEQVVTTEPSPEETAVDIVSTAVAHGSKRLSVAVRVRDLVLSTLPEANLRIVTPDRRYQVLVGRAPGSRAVAALTRRGLETDCRGLAARMDGAADVVTVSLPTGCVGAPRWVKVGAGMVRAAPSSEADPDGYVQYADDGHRDVVRGHSLGLGPKVRRG